MAHKVTLRDGRRVCPLGLGTYNLGINRSDWHSAVKALQYGIDMGLEVVDTAEMYGNEEFVGSAIADRRDRVFLVGKVLPEHADYHGTVSACERSLARLGTDHFDLYLLHWKASFPFEETLAAMMLLICQGKILRWGVSNLDVADMDRVFSTVGGDTCATDQVLYNLAHRGIEYDLIPWCDSHHLPVMAYSPILQGGLLGDSVLSDIAAEYNLTTAQIALAWTLRAGHIIALAKSSCIEHVRDNAAAIDIDLSPDQLAVLDGHFNPPTHKQALDKI